MATRWPSRSGSDLYRPGAGLVVDGSGIVISFAQRGHFTCLPGPASLICKGNAQPGHTSVTVGTYMGSAAAFGAAVGFAAGAAAGFGAAAGAGAGAAAAAVVFGGAVLVVVVAFPCASRCASPVR